jgi:hypothetical protein
MEHKNSKIKDAVRLLISAGLLLTSVEALAQTAQDDVLAVGPVESVAANQVEFSVLGRTFHAGSAVGVAVGDYVAVHGSLEPDGSTTDVWVESLGHYVPGSDAVYEKGVVTEIRPFLGQLNIGGSRIDYTPAMSSESGVEPAIGVVITLAGVQPSSNGVVLVDGLMAAADRVRDSLMKGGGVEATLMKGGGVDSSLMKGGGLQSSLMKGGGVESSLMKGGGLQSSLMKGGGVESSLMKGGGLQSSLMKGGGVESSLMKGGGLQSSLMKGGGVESSLMKGGGLQSSLMKGGGVESSLMKGGGLQSSLMKGGGVESSLMKGGGLQSSLMKGGGVAGT